MPSDLPCGGDEYVMSGPVGVHLLAILGYEGADCSWCDNNVYHGGKCFSEWRARLRAMPWWKRWLVQCWRTVT